MSRIFLDANIFFAAVKSQTGGSYFILELTKARRIGIVTVAHALAEAERNIAAKLGRSALTKHYQNLLAIQPEIQSLLHVSPALRRKTLAAVPEKDMPILLGAILSRADALITLDRRHFLNNTTILSSKINILIVTPGTFLQRYFHGNVK